MAGESLFGGDPAQIQQALNQQQQAQSMAYGASMGPQGNPFYVPGIAAGMHQGGAMLGNAVGGMMGSVPPQIQEAYKMQEIQKETDKAGIDFGQDPVGYMKVAASNLLKAGMPDKALQVMQQADQMATTKSDIGYKGAMGEQASAIANEKNQLVDDRQLEIQARAALDTAKAYSENVDSEIAQLEEKRKQAREPKELQLIDARIYNLRKSADAASNAAIRKLAGSGKMNIQNVIAELSMKKAAGQELTPSEQQVLEQLMTTQVPFMDRMMGAAVAAQGGMPGINPRMPAPVQQAPVPQPQASAPRPKERSVVPPKSKAEADNEYAALAAWGSYNPNKYIYGINPKTGKFARMPK